MSIVLGGPGRYELVFLGKRKKEREKSVDIWKKAQDVDRLLQRRPKALKQTSTGQRH